MFSSFAQRNYRLFWSGNLISLIGSWMQTTALGWLVYRITRSPLLLGLSGFFSSIPVLLVSPIGGAIVDRMDKRKLLILTQSSAMILAFVLAGLTGFKLVTVTHIFIIAFLGGLVAAFDAPARQSFTVDLVGKENLMNGIALNSLGFNTARIIGPAIAGLSLAYIGEAGCFFMNGLSFLAVIVALLMISGTNSVVNTPDPSFLEELKDGFNYLRRQPIIYTIITLVGVSHLFSLSYATLLPIFAKEILHRDAPALGALMSSVGVGAIIGALLTASLGNYPRKGLLLLSAAIVSSVFLIVFGASKWFWLSIISLAIVGFCNVVYLATSNTIIQTIVPDELRGRVISIYTLICLGFLPFGNLILGATAKLLGAPLAVILGATICLLYIGYLTYRVPSLRNG